MSRQTNKALLNPQQPLTQLILGLRNRRERDASGLFYVEGVRFVIQAIEQGAKLQTLVVCKKLLKNPLGQKIARLQKRAGLPVVRVSVEVFQKITSSAEPQGIGAIVRQRWTPLAHAKADAGMCWVALHKVRSPGNLGTIIRTCDAVGAAGLILLGRQVDPYDLATVRASMASLFTQKFVRTTHEKFHEWVSQNNGLVVGTSSDARLQYHELDFRRPTVLFMGDERKGLLSREQALCEQMVRIPMVGSADSLNLGVATGIMLYEVFRQRRADSSPP